MNWHDAYEAQMDLWKWTRSAHGVNQMYHSTDYDVLPEQTKPLLAHLIRGEHMKLIAADPIFVAAEFSDLIDVAVEGFKPEPLLQQDFLTACGFLYFERPLLIDTRDPGSQAEFIGFSWTPMAWSDKDEIIPAAPERPSDYELPEVTGVAGVALTLYERLREGSFYRYGDDGELVPMPRIVPMHLTPWYFGMEFAGNEVDVDGVQTAAASWWRPCQVTLRLMQQRISQPVRYTPQRSSRRRAERSGFTAPSETVVIRLRRPKAPTHGEPESERHFTHRFFRRGHWRAQWYPTIQAHRQVYIYRTIVGPEDAPLIIKDRAWQWDK